jgi:hypothetical protein
MAFYEWERVWLDPGIANVKVVSERLRPYDPQ